jgi:hypothetical protein
VTSDIPVDGSISIPVNTLLTASFSEAMDPATIDATTFTLQGPGSTPVSGSATYADGGATASFAPAANLAVKDMAGNQLASAFVWSFTTGPGSSSSCQLTVPLGSAGTFAVLAASTATNGGLTMVTGDIGVNPGTAVTRFPPGIQNGSMYDGGPVAA